MNIRRYENQEISGELERALKDLRDEGEKLQTPIHVEQRLLQQLRSGRTATAQRQPAPVIKYVGLLKIAAVLLFLAIGASVYYRINDQTSIAEKPAASANRPQTSDQYEVSSEFIPLIHGSLSSNALQLVRVRLPRSALLQFGLPVNMERADQMIDAEMIVGDEGLPHAIRFIQQSNLSTTAPEEK